MKYQKGYHPSDVTILNTFMFLYDATKEKIEVKTACRIMSYILN